MRVPSKIECYELICRMEMMDHIVAHSVKVCQVALALADGLAGENMGLNRELIQAGALLHDITKTRSFATRENHAESGGELLAELGFPDVGDIVRQHVKLDTYPGGVLFSEAEIVNYADKRVLHDEVVPLDRRMLYIVERYCHGEDDRRRVGWLWEKTCGLEARLFECLPFAAGELESRVAAKEHRRELESYRAACLGDSG